MNILSKPTVASAVRNLETALVELEKAQTAHEVRAEAKFTEARRIETEAKEEAADAARAARIRLKLADLLA